MLSRTHALVPTALRAALAVLALGACACDDEKPLLPGDDRVLAKVEGKPITDYDLERALDKSLGKFAVASVERNAKDEVLESLIQSRAMALLGEKKLTEQERAVLDKEVASYRESLLVKHYLSEESPPKPVTSQEIRKYYDDHPERFGAKEDARYELIFGKNPVEGASRAGVMKALTDVSKEADWNAAVATPRDGIEVSFATGSVSEKALHPNLKALLSGLQVGTPSNIVFVQGRAYLGRVTGKDSHPPKPFAEVRDEIEKTLRPVRIRDAVRSVGVEATKKVKIERTAETKKEGDNG